MSTKTLCALVWKVLLQKIQRLGCVLPHLVRPPRPPDRETPLGSDTGPLISLHCAKGQDYPSLANTTFWNSLEEKVQKKKSCKQAVILLNHLLREKTRTAYQTHIVEEPALWNLHTQASSMSFLHTVNTTDDSHHLDFSTGDSTLQAVILVFPPLKCKF